MSSINRKRTRSQSPSKAGDIHEEKPGNVKNSKKFHHLAPEVKVQVQGDKVDQAVDQPDEVGQFYPAEDKVNSSTSQEAKHKSGYGVSWSNKFIRVPTKDIGKVWMSEQGKKLIYRNSLEKKINTIVAQPGNRFVKAVKLAGDMTYHSKEKETNDPLIAFRNDQEVIAELFKTAGKNITSTDGISNDGDELLPTEEGVTPVVNYIDEDQWLEIQVKSYDLLPYINDNGMYEKTNTQPPSKVDDSDEALWKLYIENQSKALEEIRNMPRDKKIRLQVAKELFMRDPKLHTLAKDLNAAWKRDGYTYIDNHRSDSVPRPVKIITINSYEYMIIPNGLESKYHRYGDAATAYGNPMMEVLRREGDSHSSMHDHAWISVHNYCGNPYYIDKKDGKVHLSRSATGRDVQLDFYDPKVFTGCLEANTLGNCQQDNCIQRHTSISVEELEEVLLSISKAEISTSI